MPNRPLIVVVDDDPDVRKLSTDILTESGFGVEELPDGAALAGRLRMDPRPVLVLLDVNMPGLTGWGTLNELRSDPSIRDVPIVIVTSYDDPDFKRRASELGVKGYVVKPFTARDLVNRVRVALFG